MSGLPLTEEELREVVVSRLGVVDEADFARARTLARRLQVPIERTLVERVRMPYRFLLEQLAEAWDVGFVELKVSEVDPAALKLVDPAYARAQLLAPFALVERRLRVAMRDPRDRRVIAEVERQGGLRVEPYLATESSIRRALLLHNGDVRGLLERAAAGDGPGTAGGHRFRVDEGSAIELVRQLLEYAAVAQASDIHIEPYELEAVVRYRIDGVLGEVLSLPAAMLPPLVARIKILSHMRIDERRVPQDGRFDVDLDGLRLDLRVSTLPTLWGEKVVLRVLAPEAVPPDLEDLGLGGADYDVFVRNVMRPHGMVIITGPTGSGKTTTLYSVLARLGSERQSVVNISTIEDPVEYSMARVNQMPINAAAGVDFASGLRAILRQDPDIIMVGEIRDRETAEIAARAALVGRLLLSTLHTNDASGAVPRLLDVGVEPYLVASTLALVVGQRLVRRLCVACRESVSADPRVLRGLRSRPDFDDTIAALQRQGVLGVGDDPLAGVRLFRGRGCRQCLDTGFRGRLGVFELLEVDDDIRSLIMQRASGTAIRAAALANGMKTMFQDGLAKAFLGETTLEEVYRVAM